MGLRSYYIKYFAKVKILVAGGCDGWCAESHDIDNNRITRTNFGRNGIPIKHAEMYDPETNEWTDVEDLPVPLHSAKMELLDGKPTIIGGQNLREGTIEENFENGDLYQYFIETNEWKAHPTIKMKFPRSSAAVFQVPRNLFHC